MIERLLSNITGRQHHFKLAICYMPDRQRPEYRAERIVTVWMRERRHINDERQIKKKLGESLVANIPRHRRNNGGIYIREAYYLGWFRPSK